jgi:hypothetical protein
MLSDRQTKDMTFDASNRLSAIIARTVAQLRNATPEEADAVLLMLVRDAYRAGAEDATHSIVNAAAAIGRGHASAADYVPEDNAGRFAPALRTVQDAPAMKEAAEGEAGLHGSRRFIDALSHAPGSTIRKVENWGEAEQEAGE